MLKLTQNLNREGSPFSLRWTAPKYGKNEVIQISNSHKGKEEKSNKSPPKKATPHSPAIFSNSGGWWAGRPAARSPLAVDGGGGGGFMDLGFQWVGLGF
jgi:hypothetical protein